MKKRNHIPAFARAAYLTLLILAIPFFAPAQSQMIRFDDDNPLPAEFIDADNVVLDSAALALPPGAVSCFDHYTFGSVQAKIVPSVASTVSGTPITFSGSLVNNNPYPIVDGSLYVKVFKTRGESDGNGPDVVDQFVAKGDVVIPARGSAPVSFEWRVPSNAVSGEYELATYFVTSRKFNLLGLTFTDDVVGNTIPFRVSGEVSTGVQFDKSSVEVNRNPYQFAAFPPHVDATSPAEVSAQLRNTTNAPQSVTIRWTIYQWDSLLRENVVQEESRTLTVPAQSSAPASVVVTDTRYPVYYAVGIATWKDTQSIIGVRFVRDSIDRTRINFPGVTTFPLEAGVPNSLFSCLHNAGDSSLVSGSLLELTLLDRDGAVIHTYTYEGGVTASMMGVASAFTPKKSYDYVTLSARLFQGGEFIDEAYLIYDCEAIDPALCHGEEEMVSGILDPVQSLAVIALGFFVIILMVWIYRRVASAPGEATLSQ